MMKINEFKKVFDNASKELFNSLELINILNETIRYSYFSGGKRLRPWIIYNIGRYYNVEEEKLFKIGFAIEILHTASLIHDDLPAIDNSDYRRGNRTSHKEFGEWRAILTGDLGFILPYKIFYDNKLSKLYGFFSETVIKLIEGETLDVAFEKKLIVPSDKQILDMYEKKTSALFEFSFAFASLLKDNQNDFEILKNTGKSFGLAFQIYDDLKDLHGTFDEVGKDLSNDENKYTLLKIMNQDKAKKYADSLFDESILSLSKLKMNFLVDELINIKSLIERK
ncbi:polyprenyl synthetase family protein [Marinitoga sp. 38H-ov]|uniref:polyprenyl synthetase family protein n=1 Tax=Marinitoga sp. 38H-ov TaxID=1755814 RepID=UPI0013EB75E9|nr:polyprenyl synthetase family protein [Marinitoga sp. 38H-ov]KAF2955090.1 hypothetical protein AS160_02325 [Marinitoga sp. 38H-ov]